MKRILSLLCIVAVLATSMVTGAVVSFAETTSTASVTDVYASGNWTVGQTVTANYTYYDPTGKPQVGDAVIEWWRTGNLVKATNEVKVSDSPSYTLTADDKGGLYFTVTVSNEDGAGKVYYSPVYLAEDANADATKPVRKKLHIILMNGARFFEPGATVRAVHNTSFTNGKAEGATTYMWRVKDTRTGDYTIRAHTQTYTISEEDYGKWLECAVTAKDVDGTASDQLTAITYVGNKLGLDAEIKAISGTYNNKANLINRLWYQPADNIYGYKNADVSVIIDAGKYVKFDGFNLSVDNVLSGLEIAYSKDNSTWENIAGADSNVNNFTKVIVADGVKTARYFKVSFKAKNAYPVFKEAYPVLSSANRGAEYVDISSVGYGAVADNGALSISNITYGIPAKSLADSVVAKNSECEVSVTNASGETVSDASEIILTPGNVADYRIKVAYGEISQSYTLSSADALASIDISGVTDDVSRRYTTNTVTNPATGENENTGFGRNVFGTKATYWYSSAEYTDNAKETALLYPYAVREIVDGEDALKISTNGNPAANGGVVDLWYTVTGLDDEGCYSFSFKVKPDSGSSIQVLGRPYANLNTVEFVGGFVQLNTTGLFAHDGNKMVRKGDFAEDEWYTVEVVVDYKNMKKSVWVNGVNYADGVDLKFSSNTYDKTAFSMDIKILASPNGKDDVNYIKDIEFNKVWDVRTKLSDDGEPLGMKLYSGDTVAESLAAGTYCAKGNGNVFSDEYYVAVYKVEYSDSTKSSETGRSLIGAYRADGSRSAEIKDIIVPESAYSDTSEAIVKIFCWNDGMIPANSVVQID